jgi:hypothetical protein
LHVGTLQTGRIIVFIDDDQRHVLRDSKQLTAAVVTAAAAATCHGRFSPNRDGTDELEIDTRRDFTVEAGSSHQATTRIGLHKFVDTFSVFDVDGSKSNL